MIAYTKNRLEIDGETWTLEFSVLDAFEFCDGIIVLFHPDEGIKMSGQFANLVCLAKTGEKKWVAELPTVKSADAYYRISSREPLVVNSFCSYRCEIDLSTGKIIQKRFTK